MGQADIAEDSGGINRILAEVAQIEQLRNPKFTVDGVPIIIDPGVPNPPGWFMLTAKEAISPDGTAILAHCPRCGRWYEKKGRCPHDEGKE